MANLLTEQDTFFGTIAFRNKLITREQLGQAVLLVQTTQTGVRLGEALVRIGALTHEQVEAILEMQQQQRDVLKQQDESQPSAVSHPPVSYAPVEESAECSVENREIEKEDTLPPGRVVYRVPESPAEPLAAQEETLPPISPVSFSPASEVADLPLVPQPPMPDVEDEDLKIERLSEVDVSGGRGESVGSGIQIEVTDSTDEEMQIERRPTLESIEALKPALEPLALETPPPLAASEDIQPPAAPPTVPPVPGEDAAYSTLFAMPEPKRTGETPRDVESQPDDSVASFVPEPAHVPPAAQTLEPVAPVVAPVESSAGVSVSTPGSLLDLLREVRAMGASDLHISAEVRPFIRKGGEIVLLDRSPLPARETEKMLFSVLTNRQKMTLLADKGIEFCLNIEGEGRYRATIVKQRCGWDGIFRVVRSSVPSVEELGLPDCVGRLTEYHQGLVLVTGPGNSGKTTTLAALVDAVNRSRSDHVITLEQPIEYVHQARQCQITQREIGPHSESFAAALRGALRQDPDVIMVGELRDTETLSMAISASETGHLVLGTLHTTSAASTVGRVVDAFPVGQQQQIRMMLSESMRGILSQRLVPRKDRQGVVLALEILFVNSAVSALIRDNKPFQLPSVMQTARKLGMQRMEDALLDLLNQDLIEGGDAYRLASNKQPFEAWNPAKTGMR